MKSFKEYISDEVNEVTVTFGRFNPPTRGHEHLFEKVASVAAGGKYLIFSSHSKDGNKNPLVYEQKLKWARKSFPKHARAIVESSSKDVLQMLSELYSRGYTKVNLVVGSDRVVEFKTISEKYNGIQKKHGFYNFKGGVNIISAGMRDPDSSGVDGISASNLREAAASNDFISFSRGAPSELQETQALFNDIRTGLGLEESYQYREHVKLDVVSEEREKFVSGDLFNVDDEVVIKEDSEVVTIKGTGPNFLIVEYNDKRKKRVWISDVEKM